MIDLEEIDESRGGTYFPSNRRTSRSLMRRPFVRDACAQPVLASPFPPASASSDRHLISDQTTLIILKGSTLSDTVGLEADEVLDPPHHQRGFRARSHALPSFSSSVLRATEVDRAASDRA